MGGNIEVPMSAADREKWERRYSRSVGDAAARVEDFLLDVADRLPKGGRVLDLAGGTGRHALWLARRGLDVTLVDISPTALAVARSHARACGLDLRTLALDLDHDPLPPGPFRLIVCTFFLPSEVQWGALVGRLAAAGFLLVVLPTTTNLARHRRPGRRYLFSAREGPAFFGRMGLSIVRAETGWDRRGRHLLRVLAVRRSI